MSTINYTYNVIVDRFRQFAAGHFQLRRFTHGEISQADLEKEAEWPWLHVKPRAINYAPGTRTFSFEIFISDLPRDKEDKTGYQAESITDCSLIFQDLINEIYLGNMFGSNVELTRPVNSEPFVEQYTHTLTGVTGIIELNLDYDWSACSIPASWNYNTPTDSGTDGWGALQFIESLDQNGVFVSLLNDVEAPGNSYYYGTNASGVKGWYAIVDNVGLTCETLPDCATIISILDDIAALQTDVALKANTADLGATAFSNDYNDLDNLPTIPAQYNPTAGIGVSITGTYPNQTITNTAPDQTVALTAGTNIGVTGTYPNFTISNTQSLAGYVPTTRSITINGTTQDLSADRTFTIATGLTVGTTPITSGTVGRVLFEGTGNVLQESANLFWDNTNNRLGIGTATPSSSLHVVGEIRVNAGQAVILDSSNGIYASGAGNQFRIFSGGTARLNVATNGNILIGTTTDAGYKLDVNGTARVSGIARFNGGIGLNRDAFGGRALDVLGGGIRLTGSTNGSFEVNGGNSTFAINTVGGLDGLTLTDTSNAIFKFTATSYTYSFFLSGGNQRFEIRDQNQAGATRFAIANTGNVLINTTTDAGYKLDVNGTARVSGDFSLVLGNAIRFGTSLALSKTNAAMSIYGGTNAGAGGTNDLYYWNGSTYAVGIRLNNNANVLINTTTEIASSILTVESTTKGFLPPRMTTTQKNAIATPAAGLVVYDTTLNKLCVYTTAWETITSV